MVARGGGVGKSRKRGDVGQRGQSFIHAGSVHSGDLIYCVVNTGNNTVLCT